MQGWRRRLEVIEGVAQPRSRGLVCGLDGVHVDPQRHRRVGVAEPTGDGAHVVATRDRRGRGPVPKVVKRHCGRSRIAPAPGCHHHPMRSGLAGPGRVGEDVRARSARDWTRSSSIASTVAGSRVRVRRLPVLVATSIHDPHRRGARSHALLSTGEHGCRRDRSIAARRARPGADPATAARRKASAAAGSKSRAASITARTSSALIASRDCTFRLAQSRLARDVDSHPSPAEPLRQRGAQRRVAAPDRRFADTRLAESRHASARRRPRSDAPTLTDAIGSSITRAIRLA